MISRIPYVGVWIGFCGALHSWRAIFLVKGASLSGSCVVFHDYGWAEGVKCVIEEDVKPRCECFDSLPNMFWGYLK